MWSILQPPQYAPAPSKWCGDLQAFPFRWYGWFSITKLSGLVTFDILTLELVCNVSRGTDNLPPNVGVSATICCRVMGKRASDWRHDLITLTFDLWGHRACRWVIILHPCTKFEVRWSPLWRSSAFSFSAIIGLETMTFDLLTSNGVTGQPCHELPSCHVSASYVALPTFNSKWSKIYFLKYWLTRLRAQIMCSAKYDLRETHKHYLGLIQSSVAFSDWWWKLCEFNLT